MSSDNSEQSGLEGPFKDLEDRRRQARLGGGKERLARQHEKGKLSARERIEILLDNGSFQELGMFVRHQTKEFGLENNRPYGDGVVRNFPTKPLGSSPIGVTVECAQACLSVSRSSLVPA